MLLCGQVKGCGAAAVGEVRICVVQEEEFDSLLVTQVDGMVEQTVSSVKEKVDILRLEDLHQLGSVFVPDGLTQFSFLDLSRI